MNKTVKITYLSLITLLFLILIFFAYFSVKEGKFKYIEIENFNFFKNETRNTHPVEKEENVFRIAIIGDSMTYGLSMLESKRLSDEEIFSHILEERLNNNSQITKEIEVLNFGLPGSNTKHQADYFLKHAVNYEPDLLIIGFFSNDVEDMEIIDQIMNEVKYEEKFQKMLREEKDIDEVQYQILMESIKRFYSDVFPQIEDKFKIVRDPLEKLYNEISMPVLVMCFYDTHDYQIKELIDITNKYNWSLLELNWMIEEYGEAEVFISLEIQDVHPSRFAHKIIAEELYKKLIEDNLVPYEK